MTPKEKAEELIDKYLDCENYNNLNLDLFCDECGMSTNAAKICALICVDEIINQFKGIYESLKVNGIITGKVEESENYKYWQEVKQKLNKL